MADQNYSNIQVPPTTTMSAHVAAENPHPQYLMVSELVSSVSSFISLENLHNVVVSDPSALSGTILVNDAQSWIPVSAVEFFTSAVTYATTTDPGIVTLATSEDIDSGVTTTVVTPNLLKSQIDRYDEYFTDIYARINTTLSIPKANTIESGIVRLATINDFTGNTRDVAITPPVLKNVSNNLNDSINLKQDKLTAGTGVNAAKLAENIVEVTGVQASLVAGNYIDANALANNNTISVIGLQPALIAGTGINAIRLLNNNIIEVSDIPQNSVTNLVTDLASKQPLLANKGRFTELVNGSTVDCTLQDGEHIEIDPVTNRINCTVDYDWVDSKNQGPVFLTDQLFEILKTNNFPANTAVSPAAFVQTVLGFLNIFSGNSENDPQDNGVNNKTHSYGTCGSLVFPLFRFTDDRGDTRCLAIISGTIHESFPGQCNISLACEGYYQLNEVLFFWAHPYSGRYRVQFIRAHHTLLDCTDGSDVPSAYYPEKIKDTIDSSINSTINKLFPLNTCVDTIIADVVPIDVDDPQVTNFVDWFVVGLVDAINLPKWLYSASTLPTTLIYTQDSQVTAGYQEQAKTLYDNTHVSGANDPIQGLTITDPDTGTIIKDIYVRDKGNTNLATKMRCASPIYYIKAGNNTNKGGSAACALKYRSSFTRYHKFEDSHAYVIEGLSILISLGHGDLNTSHAFGFTIYFEKLYIYKEYKNGNTGDYDLIVDPAKSIVKTEFKANSSAQTVISDVFCPSVILNTSGKDLSTELPEETIQNNPVFILNNSWLVGKQANLPLTLDVGYNDDEIYFEISGKIKVVTGRTWGNVRLFYSKDVSYTMVQKQISTENQNG